MHQNPELSQLMKLAQSPSGQKLLSLLQQTGGSELQNAIQKASSGDYSQAKKTLSALLTNPEAQTLLKELEEQL